MTIFTIFVSLTRLTAMLAVAWIRLRMSVLAPRRCRRTLSILATYGFTNLQNISGKAHARLMLFFMHVISLAVIQTGKRR